MENDLLEEVKVGIAARKGDWKRLAAEIPEVSYSWISQIGRDQYKSAPSYDRLKAVANYFKSKKVAS